MTDEKRTNKQPFCMFINGGGSRKSMMDSKENPCPEYVSMPVRTNL